jgi:hypothetical protein
LKRSIHRGCPMSTFHDEQRPFLTFEPSHIVPSVSGRKPNVPRLSMSSFSSRITKTDKR